MLRGRCSVLGPRRCCGFAITPSTAAARTRTYTQRPSAANPVDFAHHPLAKATGRPLNSSRWRPEISQARLRHLQGHSAHAAMAASRGDVSELPVGVEAEERLLETFAGVPGVSGAWCLPKSSGETEIRVQFSQRNLPANKMRAFTSCAVLPKGWTPLEGQQPVVSWSWPVENSDTLMTSFSPSGKSMILCKAPASATDSVAIELWSAGRLKHTTCVPKSLHGAIVNDGYFATGASWSPDETRVVYTAEVPRPEKSKKFGRLAAEAGKEATPAAAPPTWEGVGPWEQDWGEKNVGKQSPSLFVLRVDEGTVTAVSCLPGNTSFGQPVWTPSGEELVCVGWAHQAENFPQSAMRLGVVYCYNRPCHLWRVPAAQASADSEPAMAECITPGLGSAQAPRFSPDGSRLVFLSWGCSVSTGVHNGTASLFSLSWPQAGDPDEVVPIRRTPDPNTGFPGIYAGFGSTLIEQPFLDEDTVVVGTQWRSHMSILTVTLSTGEVQMITPTDGLRPSFSLLARDSNLLVAAASGPCAPPQIVVAHMGSPGGPPVWRVLREDPTGDAAEAAEALDSIEHHVLQVSPSTSGLSDLPFEAIVVRPKASPAGPTVLMPHGGPHHAYPSAYFLPFAYLAACGYTVILCNFRGSTGFGEDSVQSLPGNIGQQDVADNMDALAAAVDAGYADPDNVAVCGGSHGGFLTGHLVGQHPQAFKAGVLRNPVLDMGLMVFCSDIPDWTFVEAWGTEEAMARFKPRPDAEDLERFHQVSPIRHVAAVQAPLLFMLGAQDMRVPWSDAKHYISTISSRPDCPPVRTFLFPEDSHALDRPQTEFEQWLNTVAWLREHGVGGQQQ